MTTPPDDPNPVFQSLIAEAREIYPTLQPGYSRRLSCVKALLAAQDPLDWRGSSALIRLRAWAENLRFPVEEVIGTEARNKGELSHPALIRVHITKPKTTNPDHE